MKMRDKNDLVTIEVVGEEPDALQRIALLNGALFRVLQGVKLIEIREADYRTGRIQAIVERCPSPPRVNGRVQVRYKPASRVAA